MFEYHGLARNDRAAGPRYKPGANQSRSASSSAPTLVT